MTGCLCSKYCACTEGLPWDSPGNATGSGYRLQDFGFSVQGMDDTVSGFSFTRWKGDSQEPVEVACYASMPCFEEQPSYALKGLRLYLNVMSTTVVRAQKQSRTAHRVQGL